MLTNNYFIANKKATIRLGLAKALILQAIDFYTDYNAKNKIDSVLIDGNYYMYHSFKQWTSYLEGLIQQRALIRAIQCLEEEGYIIVIRSEDSDFWQANYYRLTGLGHDMIDDTPVKAVVTTPPAWVTKPNPTLKPKPATQPTPTPPPSAPKPAPTRPCATITNDGLVSEDSTLLDALNDFIKYRKQLGKYTALSHKALINKINKVLKEGAEVDSVIDAIYKSIECGWRGVFFDSKQSGLIATGAGGWADGVKILANGSVLCTDGTKRAVNHDGRTGADIMKYFPDPVYMEV